MDHEQSTWIAIFGAGFGLVGTIWSGWLQYLNRRLELRMAQNKKESQTRDTVTDDRVDLLYRSNYERGVLAAQKRPDLVIKPCSVKELIPQGSSMANLVLEPSSISPEAKQAFAPIVPMLRDIRRMFPDPVKFTEVLLRDHGAWLLRHICGPLDVHDNECIAIARAMSEEGTGEVRAMG